MAKTDMSRYEVWLETDDVSGRTLVVVTGWELESGQALVLASKEFSGATQWTTIAQWVGRAIGLPSEPGAGSLAHT